MPEDPALETLSVINYLFLETGSFQMHLSQCLNINQLKGLGLSAVDLINVSSWPFQVLIVRAPATLQDLGLDKCGIRDSQFNVILPALGRCSQLTVIQLLWQPHLRGRPGEPAAPHQGAEPHAVPHSQ